MAGLRKIDGIKVQNPSILKMEVKTKILFSDPPKKKNDALVRRVLAYVVFYSCGYTKLSCVFIHAYFWDMFMVI